MLDLALVVVLLLWLGRLVLLALTGHAVDDGEARGLEAKAIRGLSLLCRRCARRVLLVHKHLNIVVIVDTVLILQ